MLTCPLCGNATCYYQFHPSFYYCDSCSIAFRNPATIAYDRKGAYDPDWITRHSSNTNVHNQANYIVGIVTKFRDIGDVLDVGCGSGVLVNKLARLGYNATGIDWHDDAISFARQNMQGKFLVGDANNDIMAGNCSFDVVIASHILEHLQNPNKLLESAWRLLKRNGYLCIVVPNLGWYCPDVPWRQVSSVFDKDHVICYSHQGLGRLVVANRFRCLSVHTRTHKTEILDGLVTTLYRSMLSKTNDNGCARAAGNNSKRYSILRKLYELVASSGIMFPIMRIPNKISERKHRGSELIVIAKVEKDE